MYKVLKSTKNSINTTIQNGAVVQDAVKAKRVNINNYSGDIYEC